MNEIWLIRHGVTRANQLGVIQGQGPEPLSSAGREQARKLGQWLAALGPSIDELIASPLERAAQTAAIIARHLGFDDEAIATEPRLAERSFGDLEGGSTTEAYGQQAAAGDPRAWRPPNGESFIDLEERVADGFASIAERPGDRGMVITHGGPIVALASRALGLELGPERFGRLRCDNTSVTILSRADADREFRLLTYNAHFHL